MFPPNTLEELKQDIKRIWDSISPDSITSDIFNRIINHTQKRQDLSTRHKGREMYKDLLKIIFPEEEKKGLKLQKLKINDI